MADAVDQLLTVAISITVTPDQPSDTIDSLTITGIPGGATAAFVGFPAVTVTNGVAITDAAFLTALKAGSQTLNVTLAEHDSADFTVTADAVVDGTATGPDDAAVTVDTVAAQPALTSTTGDSQPESGSGSTTLTLTVEASFAEVERIQR